ncbi:MAG: hypothetical protein ACYCXH_05980, partial [Bellilinea sp.]
MVIVSISACNATSGPKVSTEEQVSVIIDPTPDSSTEIPAQTPMVVDSTPEVPTEAEQDYTNVIDNPVFSGIMVLAENHFIAIDHFTQPMGFFADAEGETWISETSTGVTKKNVFLSTYDGLVMVTTAGKELVSFAGTNRVSSTDVSRDGSLLAWVSEEIIDNGVHYELWVANIDGSDPVLAYEIGADRTRVEPMALEIRGWTADNQVIFSTRADGIGGYILYNGWIDLFAFDPAIPAITHQYISDDTMRMCVNSVSDDFSLAAVGCNAIHVQNLVTGEAVELPIIADQNFAGSAKFSPSNTRVAYSIARGDPDNERSQLLVAPVDGSSPPVALDTIEGGHFTVHGWIDENTLLYSSSVGFGGTTAVWRVETDDSSKPFKIADGLFIGFIY